MRVKPESLLIVTLAAFAFTGVVAVVLNEVDLGAHTEVLVDPIDVQWATVEVTPVSGAEWLQSVRQQCTPDDVVSTLRTEPAPTTDDGTMHEAACLALAGQVSEARRVIEGRLPPELHFQAAGVVFNAGHPAADAGDEIAAGPLMELVVDYWPNHYMALYHAGASSFERGEHDKARGYLDRFLAEYTVQDGWTLSARMMLDEMPAVQGRSR